jgi:O-antigen/teichoic acid export membrane protein
MSNATLRQRAVRGGAVVMITRLSAQVFQWAVTLLVVRLLLPDDYGMMTFAGLFLGFADLLAEMGIGKALVQRTELTQEDVAQGFTLSLALSALLYVVIFFLSRPAADYLERPEFTIFLRVLGLTLFFTPWRTISGALLEREIHLGRYSAAQLAAVLIQAVLVISLAWAEFGYWALACGVLVGRSGEAVFLTFASGRRPRITIPSRAALQLMRFGVHIAGSSLLWFIYTNADFAVLGALLGPVLLGYYSLALQIISLPVQKIAATANQVMFAVYCKVRDDRAQLRDWLCRLMALQDFFAFPVLAGIALVAEDGLPLLLGIKWQPAVLPLQLLCPVGACMMVGSGLPPLLNAIGRPDINLRFSALCAGLLPLSFVGAAWWGSHKYGGEGALVGVCLVWLVLHPLLVTGLIYVTRHLTGVSPSDLLRSHLPILAGLSVMTFCVLSVQRLASQSPASVRLTGAIGVGVASYTFWMLATARNTILADLAVVWRELRHNKPNQIFRTSAA